MNLPEIDNIVSICIGLDIAIIGIAYPVFIDKITNMGEKYNSVYLSKLFESEFPQRKITGKAQETSYLILAIYITVLSFIPLIFQFPPYYDWEKYWLIKNSADIIVFITSGILTFFFFKWIRVILKYSSLPTNLLNYLLNNFNTYKLKNKAYHLKTINELSKYAIRNQDIHLQETLMNFYFEKFHSYQKEHTGDSPLKYDVDLYQFNYDIISELIDKKNNKLYALEHRAVSGTWILGEGFGSIEISEESYEWLWRNLNLIVQKPSFIKMYWERADQHYDFKLPPIERIVSRKTFKIENESEIGKREKEREKFIEFNYAFCGLLMFKKRYESIKYILNYSRSIPPNYVLLPIGMTQIFKMVHRFSNNNYLLENEIERKYWFHGLDDFWGDEVRRYINLFLATLFIRQFKLKPFYTFHEFRELPILPEKLIRLNHWLDNIEIIEKSVNDIKGNKELISILKYDDIIKKDKEEKLFSGFLKDLQESIKEKIKDKKNNVELERTKVDEFNKKTDSILKETFDQYKVIQNEKQFSEEESVTNFTLEGSKNLFPKISFTKESNSNDYDSFFVERIIKTSINQFIPNTFLKARTKRYLLNRNDVLTAIRKLKIDKEYVIVVINMANYRKDFLEEYKEMVIELNVGSKIRDTFFILKKNSLPRIENIPLSEEEIKNNKLTSRNNKFYTSVLDLNLEKNNDIRKKWLEIESDENIKKKVQVAIAFKTVVTWKNKRDVVQLNIYSKYLEQGIVNNLNDIESLE